MPLKPKKPTEIKKRRNLCETKPKSKKLESRRPGCCWSFVRCVEVFVVLVGFAGHPNPFRKNPMNYMPKPFQDSSCLPCLILAVFMLFLLQMFKSSWIQQVTGTIGLEPPCRSTGNATCMGAAPRSDREELCLGTAPCWILETDGPPAGGPFLRVA